MSNLQPGGFFFSKAWNIILILVGPNTSNRQWKYQSWQITAGLTFLWAFNLCCPEVQLKIWPWNYKCQEKLIRSFLGTYFFTNCFPLGLNNFILVMDSNFSPHYTLHFFMSMSIEFEYKFISLLTPSQKNVSDFLTWINESFGLTQCLGATLTALPKGHYFQPKEITLSLLGDWHA